MFIIETQANDGTWKRFTVEPIEDEREAETAMEKLQEAFKSYDHPNAVLRLRKLGRVEYELDRLTRAEPAEREREISDVLARHIRDAMWEERLPDTWAREEVAEFLVGAMKLLVRDEIVRQRRF